MGLKDVPLKKTYSSDTDDVLHEFYIPVLKESVKYYRLAGFFSSTSLTIAARGITHLIRNGGVMKVIACPRLTKEEINAIINAKENPETYIEGKMLQELDDLTEEFVRDHIYALGWMVANSKLEIKIAIVYDEYGCPLTCDEINSSGIFHQKVGILEDNEGNIITFSGSINESAIGWLENIEEFKVFRSWIPVEKEYVEADIEEFEKFWKNKSPKVKVIDIPKAVKDKLIKIAPRDINELHLERWYKKSKKKTKNIKLYPYQIEAVNAWIENGKRGIFKMATGAGKTFTALGCVEKVFAEFPRVLLIVTCPYQHIAEQWKKSLDKFGISYDKLIEAHSGKPWKNKLADALIDLSLGYLNKVVVITTHTTFSKKEFIEIIKENKEGFKIFLIGDEVHWLGAKKRRRGLLEDYDFRLGLSATPERWFDPIGTRILYDYFGGILFEFSLEDALTKINPATGKTYLTWYKYIPYFVSLTEDELEEYQKKTEKIVNLYNQAKDDEQKAEILERLLFRRADIIKNASEKYVTLEKILDNLGREIKHALIYCTPQQIDEVMKIINKKGLIAHRFTMEEGTKPEKKYNGLSEREYILQKFAQGEYQVLVAMKCLDEGVDVPPAKIAILMASSGNPREYIQRIGRIIRRFPSKNEAVIYDTIVVPSFKYNQVPKEMRELENKIFEKELQRYEEIAKLAINNVEALMKIYNLKRLLYE